MSPEKQKIKRENSKGYWKREVEELLREIPNTSPTKLFIKIPQPLKLQVIKLFEAVLDEQKQRILNSKSVGR